MAMRNALHRHSREPSREQAHVPAQQSSSGPYPRVPCPHANPRRPCHPVGPSSQGPFRAVRIVVLPAPARLRQSKDFKATVRHGVRTGRPTVVVHADLAEQSGVPSDGVVSARVGFVVSRKVGNAVTRNRVRRRLRHLAAAQLRDGVRADLRVVVRALPASATQPDRLADDFRAAWRKSIERLEARA